MQSGEVPFTFLHHLVPEMAVGQAHNKHSGGSAHFFKDFCLQGSLRILSIIETTYLISHPLVYDSYSFGGSRKVAD